MKIRSNPSICQAIGAGGIAPSEYFLADFEVSLDLTQTKNPEEMKAAVSALAPDGPTGIENIYNAALQTLSRSLLI